MTLDYFYGQAGKLFSFYRIPKALFQEQRFQNLSTDAKTLYGILLDRMSLSVKNEWFDKQGRVFIIFTIEDVKRALCCADNKATKLLRELENFGLIERKRRGLGKPSLVYGQQISNLIRQAYGKHLKVFDQTIPRSVRAAETSTTGKSIFQYDPKGKVAEAYHSIAKGVLADAEKRLKRQFEQLR